MQNKSVQIHVAPVPSVLLSQCDRRSGLEQISQSEQVTTGSFLGHPSLPPGRQGLNLTNPPRCPILLEYASRCGTAQAEKEEGFASHDGPCDWRSTMLCSSEQCGLSRMSQNQLARFFNGSSFFLCLSVSITSRANAVCHPTEAPADLSHFELRPVNIKTDSDPQLGQPNHRSGGRAIA